MSLVFVAIPIPGLEPLTYNVPPQFGALAPGTRVIVPVGRRTMTGCVVPAPQPDPTGTPLSTLKDIIDVLDTTPFLPSDVVDLALWAAEYYAAGPGETLASAMPPFAFTQRRPGRASGYKTIAFARLSAMAIGGGESTGETAALRPRQLDAIAMLRGRPTASRCRLSSAAASRAPASSALRSSASLSSIAASSNEIPLLTDHRPPTTDHRPPISLTSEQVTAVSRLIELATRHAFEAAVLHGVTGSGKTEIYLRLADKVQSEGRRVLLLVPEIGLTPAIAATFRGAFGQRVAIQHSGLSDGERHDQWQRIRAGDIDVVVGTRSAVFAPLPSLGLIIVDEEHDASYKQEESPRYHARDVAVMRAKRAGALVVLGSATPSMESYQNALAGRYERVVLAQRVLDRPLAAVRVVDMREEYAATGPDTIISSPLHAALGVRIAEREQALILLNRRGFATSVFCRQCAATLECPNCSVTLTVHQAVRRARCHYCNYSTAVPVTCRSCGGPYLEQMGFGTERVEAVIRDAFPDARVGRIDRDTVRKRGAVGMLLGRFARHELDVLVGTQMIAKGHDFPEVTLVGVISADVGLGMADFRAAERTFQLLTQVAGRAGRGAKPGEAIIQTLYPNHYSIRHACRQDYAAFFEEEIKFRRSMLYPPIVPLVNAVVRARSLNDALGDAGEIVKLLRPAGGFRVLGPAPAPLGKLRGEYRAQFFLKGLQGNTRAVMREALVAALATRPDLRRRVTVDVDPLSVL